MQLASGWREQMTTSFRRQLSSLPWTSEGDTGPVHEKERSVYFTNPLKCVLSGATRLDGLSLKTRLTPSGQSAEINNVFLPNA